MKNPLLEARGRNSWLGVRRRGKVFNYTRNGSQGISGQRAVLCSTLDLFNKLTIQKIIHFINMSIDCLSCLWTLQPPIVRQSEVIVFQLTFYPFLKLYKYCIILHRKSNGQHLKCLYDVPILSHPYAQHHSICGFRISHF